MTDGSPPGAQPDDMPPDPQPAVQQLRGLAEYHARCGLLHRRNCCPLPYGIDIGPPMKAAFPGECGVCAGAFILEGDGRSTSMRFSDMGYVHHDCVLELLARFLGPTEIPLAQRVTHQCESEARNIADQLRAMLLSERNARATTLPDCT